MLQRTMITTDNPFKHLEDRSLLDAAKRLATAERRATAALLRALMEVDGRRLFLGEGCASMFAYCTQVLRLAEGAAYNRIEAARAAREYPLILELFELSAVTLTTVRLLAPHLTAENHDAVLAAARHKPKREIEELVAALRPRPDAPAIVRKLPTLRTAPIASLLSAGTVPAVSPRSAAESRSEVPPQLRVERTRVAPLAPERYRIQLTISRETHDKFRRAQALLRHAIPSGDAAEIFDRAVTLLVGDLERKRFAETSRPRSGGASTSKPTPEHSRYIPATVRREVWRRDGGRCAFVGTEGLCREGGFLEFHHLQPYAAGGAATVENVQLRCRAHNRYEASLFFGAGVVREASLPWDGVLSQLVPGRVLETSGDRCSDVTRVGYSIDGPCRWRNRGVGRIRQPFGRTYSRSIRTASALRPIRRRPNATSERPADRIHEMLTGEPRGVGEDHEGCDSKQRSAVQQDASVHEPCGHAEEADLQRRALDGVEEAVKERGRPREIPKGGDLAPAGAVRADCRKQHARADNERHQRAVGVHQVQGRPGEHRAEQDGEEEQRRDV